MLRAKDKKVDNLTTLTRALRARLYTASHECLRVKLQLIIYNLNFFRIE